MVNEVIHLPLSYCVHRCKIMGEKRLAWKGGVASVYKKGWFFLVGDDILMEWGVSEGGFSFVSTLGIGIVEWQRIHVRELKAEL